MKILKLALVLALTLVALDARAKSDLICLAENIYHEARNQPVEGQVAVAKVTLNRVNHKHFPDSVCEVVYAPKQFSWTSHKNKPVTEAKAWLMSLVVAQLVILTHSAKPEFTATHFHTRQVNPYWNRRKEKVATIGNHVFYASK